MEEKAESHDQSFEDFKPQKANKKVKQEKKIEGKGTIKESSNKDSNAKTSTCSTSITCVVCNVSVEKDELECHLSSCMKKYKRGNEKESERKVTTGKRREQLSCFICNQIITSLSIHQREEHVNSCLNKQEAKRKWGEVGLSNNRKKPRTSTVMDCPLCGQSFHSSEARHNHLKTCSTKRNMSTKQLIEAVRLQEKHARERKDAGLPPIMSSSSRTALRKSNRQKQCKPQQPKDKSEEDLQTALALSASLTESMNNKVVKQLATENSDNIAFQFSNNTDHNHVVRLHPRQERKPFKRKILKSQSNPTLLLRKEEERAKLLEERVSNLLSNETPSCCTKNHNEKDTTSKPFKRKHSSIFQISSTGCHLWSFSGKQDIAQNEFYVSSLRDLVSPSKVQAGSKLRRLSQLPGSSLSQKLPVCTSLQYNDKDASKCEISTQECIDLVLEDDIPSNNKTEEVGGFCFQKQDCSLSFEQNHEANTNVKSSLKLATMFRSLVGKEAYSDISVIADYGDTCIPAHSLILNVRCPDAIKDIKSSHYSDSKPFLDWNDIPSDAAIAFLEVIYSGNTSSQLNNKEHIKKLVYRYNAQHLFEDLQMFLEMEPKQSKFKKSDTKELNDMLNGIWQNCSEPFKNSARFNTESQDTSDTDDLENVYHYLSQKQCKGEKSACKEADTDEDEESTEFLENDHSTSDISVCIRQGDKRNKNRILYHSSDSCNKLNNVCRNTDEDSITCELPIITTKKSNSRMGRHSLGIHSSPELFDSESDTETKLSKSINKLQSIDLKEENLIQQTKSSNSLTSLEDSPYHFSEEDNYYHEKYSSPVKRFGRKKPLEVASKFEFSSPIKSSFQKDEIDSTAISKRTSSRQQINNHLTPTKTQCIENKRSPKKAPLKAVHNSNSCSPHQTKIPLKNVSSCNDLSQIKDSQPQSPFSQKQMSSLKKTYRKCTEDLNKSQNEKNDCYNDNVIQYDIWDDFHDNSYNEFIADFGMNDNSYDNDYIIGSQITEKMSPPVEIAADSFVNEVGKTYALPTPSPTKEKSLLCDSPTENNKKDSLPCWKKNGIKKNSRVKRKVCSQNKKARAKNDITPMPNYNQMVTPELKQHCTKFGVKKLPRKKAVAILTHIYEETHPFVTDSEYDTSLMSTSVNPTPTSSRERNPDSIEGKQGYCKQVKNKQSEKLKQTNKKKLTRTNLLQKIHESKQTKTVASNVKFTQQSISKSVSVKDSEEVSRLGNNIGNILKDADEQPPSQTSSQSSMSDMLEESLIVEEESNNPDEQNIHKKLQAYIQENIELYEKILKYEPINLTEFHKNIKGSGIKVSTARLIDFFDEECITFSMPRGEKAKEKQLKRTKRYQKRRAAAIAKHKYSSTQ